MANLRKWSTTADDNATADSTVNWQEGQAPSTANNSARAMMSTVAVQYRPDSWHWVEHSASASVASQTVIRFGAAGDLTSQFHAGRRVRLTGGSSTRYSTIVSASYTSETTVTIGVDSGSLSASHNIAALGPALSSSPIPGVGGAGTPWTLLSDGAASGASYILDGIPARFNWLRLLFSLRPATDGQTLSFLLRTGAGSDVTSYNYTYQAAESATPSSGTSLGTTSVIAAGTTENTSPQGVAAGEILIHNIQSSDHKHGTVVGSYLSNSGAFGVINTGFQAGTTSAITGVKLLFASGNITAGRVRVEAC